MELILVSPPWIETKEPSLLADFIDSGLEHYHVRKPGLTDRELGEWLARFPYYVRERIVLHEHHHLAQPLGIPSLHWKDSLSIAQVFPCALKSRACHSQASIELNYGHYDRLLLSPVFDSLSKKGLKGSTIDWAACIHKLKQTTAPKTPSRFIALGGITEERLPWCKSMGFDGVAVLGSVWLAPSPKEAFKRLQRALSACSTI